MTTHTPIVAIPPTTTPATGWQRTVLRWMPTFLGFPAGGLAAQGAICGAIVGAAQATILFRRLGRLALALPAALSALWALGWIITASAGVDVETQYTVFGASGAVVVTAATSVLALALTNRTAASQLRSHQ